MEQQINSLPTIEVELKKPNPFTFLRKICAICIGLFGILLGIGLCFTIIGIIPAIFIWIGSCAMFAGAFDYYKVECPSCKKRNYVMKKKEDFKCKRCSQPTIIQWHKK